MESQENKVEAPVNTDNAANPLELDAKASASAADAGAQPKDKPAQKAAVSPEAFDARKSYEELRANFDKTSRSYQELRRESTRWAQERADFQKKLDTLTELLSKATETPIDPAQFIRDLQAQGPKALEPHFEKWSAPVREKYEKNIQERDNRIFQLERDFALTRFRNDATNYPDFTKLEDTMREIAEDPKCNVDWNKSPTEIYHDLYNLAKQRSADEAVRRAKEEGAKEAELKLAKEANAAVAGGGKSGGSATPDWDKMSAEKMREVVAQLHGVADRD